MDPHRGAMTAAVLVALAAIVGCSTPPAEPPRRTSWAHTEVERRIAIGDVSKLSPPLQRAFDPIDHVPMLPPEPTDWLAMFDESAQTFDAHRTGGFPALDATRRVLYIQPLGDLAPEMPSLDTLADIVHAYYDLEVRVLPVVPLDDVPAQRRGLDRRGGPAQIFSQDVFRWLVPRVPADAQAVIAVTMMDVYPHDNMWFLFGHASFTDRVAIASFARFDPAFYNSEARQTIWRERVLARTAFLVIHELGHTFGLSHCTYYECPFAGINSHRELDRRPLHACPVCLRKLHGALGFDPAAREDTLANVLGAAGLTDEAAWSTRRAAWIRTGAR
jgi:archaemetzincin